MSGSSSCTQPTTPATQSCSAATSSMNSVSADRVLGLHEHRPLDADRRQLAVRPLRGDRGVQRAELGVIHE